MLLRAARESFRRAGEVFRSVFAGRVVSVQLSYDPDGRTVTREDRGTIGFEVSAVWKGTVYEEMNITTPPTGGSMRLHL